MTEKTGEEFESPFPETIDYEITDVLDLHSFRPDEVAAATSAYLSEASKKGLRFVRIIHGKGIGVQRDIVRKILKETEFVKGFRSGDEFSGGWGATVAELEMGHASSSTSAQVSSPEASE